MAKWSASLEGSPYGPGYPAYSRRLMASLCDLPPAFTGELAGFRRSLGWGGALLIRAVPVPGNLPATPARPFTEVREPTGTEAIVLAAVALVGDVISFADWHDGDRVQNIYPLRGQARAQNANNSVYLELHTETAFRPDTPDLIALLCLRDGSPAATLVCDGIAAWQSLAPRQQALLAMPAFGFDLPGGGRTPAKPLVTQTPRGPRLNYAEAVSAETPEHQSALAAFHQTLRDQATPVVLEPGDLLVIDNAHLVHGRSAIDARFDGSDRWLQRALGRSAPQPTLVSP